jgi:hypothetical protein
MPESRIVLPAPKLLNLTRVRATEKTPFYSLGEDLLPSCSLCPVCGRGSTRVHSRYTRMLADLPPWQGIPVTLFTCAREEVLLRRGSLQPNYLRATIARCRRAHYARTTERLDGWFTNVSFALGGEAGSRRLLKDLGVVVSGETLLNHIRSSRLLGSTERPKYRAWRTSLIVVGLAMGRYYYY